SDLKIPQQLQSHPKKPASETSVAPKDDDRHNINADDQVMLIVEDDSRFIKIMIDKAHEHGLKAVVATNYLEIFEAIQKYNPIGITLDVKLPEANGWKVLQALKNSVL